MKTGLLIASLCLNVVANAQFSAGLKLNLSYGNISSDNLVDNLDYQRKINTKITEWNVDQRWGIGFGYGGFIAYIFPGENFSFLAEPTIDFQRFGIDFHRVENKLNSNGDGNIETESTTSDLKITYFNLPLLVRYSLPNDLFFVQAGVGINFTGEPTILSTEMVQKDHYQNFVLDNTTIEPSYNLETKLNVYPCTRFNLVLGIGKAFDVAGRKLAIDVRYNIPLTQSEMFTTNPTYNDGLFRNNNLLGIDGKQDAEKSAPFLLNDFKMSMVTVSASYTLFKK